MIQTFSNIQWFVWNFLFSLLSHQCVWVINSRVKCRPAAVWQRQERTSSTNNHQLIAGLHQTSSRSSPGWSQMRRMKVSKLLSPCWCFWPQCIMGLQLKQRPNQRVHCVSCSDHRADLESVLMLAAVVCLLTRDEMSLTLSVFSVSLPASWGQFGSSIRTLLLRQLHWPEHPVLIRLYWALWPLDGASRPAVASSFVTHWL